MRLDEIREKAEQKVSSHKCAIDKIQGNMNEINRLENMLRLISEGSYVNIHITVNDKPENEKQELIVDNFIKDITPVAIKAIKYQIDYLSEQIRLLIDKE